MSEPAAGPLGELGHGGGLDLAHGELAEHVVHAQVAEQRAQRLVARHELSFGMSNRQIERRNILQENAFSSINAQVNPAILKPSRIVPR